LNIQKGVARVRFAGEHALEFEIRKLLLERIEIAGNRAGGLFIPLLLDELEQIRRLAQPLVQPAISFDDLFEPRPLASQLLRPLTVTPDTRVFEFPPDLGQTLLFLIDVKDTSGDPRGGLACP
jgi:hypothetical protein